MTGNRLAQHGFCLIELMLSLYLASFALLGLAMLAYKSLLISYSACLYGNAEQQVFAATELLRTNGSLQIWQQELLLPEVSYSSGPGQAIKLSWYDKYSKRYASISLPYIRPTTEERRL